MRDLTKGEITTIALEILASRNVNAWRQNNVRAVRGRTFTGRKGVPDIIGFNKSTAVFTVVEVKANGDRIRPDQKVFLTQVAQAGGIALIARQDETGKVVLEEMDVKVILNKIEKTKAELETIEEVFKDYKKRKSKTANSR